MIDLDEFANTLKGQGYTFVTGSRSDLNEGMFNILKLRHSIVETTSTPESIAVAGGAALNGEKVCVLIDERTLLSSMQVLEELTLAYNLPFLGILVSSSDEMILQNHLDDDLILHKIRTTKLDDKSPIEEQIQKAINHIKETEKPIILQVKATETQEIPQVDTEIPKPTLPTLARNSKGKELRTLAACIPKILDSCPDGTRYFTADNDIRDLLKENNVKRYLPFGNPSINVAAIALGHALSCDKSVVMLDRAETLVPNLSTLTTIGTHSPKNLLHVTYSDKKGSIDIAALAHTCGYPSAYTIDSSKDLQKTTKEWADKPNTTMIEMNIKPEDVKADFPIVKENTLEQKKQFLEGINELKYDTKEEAA